VQQLWCIVMPLFCTAFLSSGCTPSHGLPDRLAALPCRSFAVQAKAYTTRVGAGPYPTEIFGEVRQIWHLFLVAALVAAVLRGAVASHLTACQQGWRRVRHFHSAPY